MTITTPVGTTDPADFQLSEDGTPFDGTGFTVTLLFYEAGVLLATPVLTPTWLDQDAGTVRVTGGEALAVGQYKFRFKVTNGAGKFGFFPNADSAGHWRVVKVQA